MRVAIFTVGMIVFSAGFVLQYGAWLIAWLSRLFGLHPPAATYADFVEGIATTMMLENGFLRVMAPWALMAVGVTLLAVSGRAGHRNDVSP